MEDAESKAIALGALTDLSEAVHGREVDRVVSMFEEGTVLAGTSVTSIGTDAIRPYLQALANHPSRWSWAWDSAAIIAGGDTQTVWFFVPLDAVETPADETEPEVRTPMRMSGVLHQGAQGRWRWAQFHGSIPGA